MNDWHTLLVAVAVLAVFALFRFVGCSFEPKLMVSQPYADDVVQDQPVVYYRMQELPGADTAHDEMGHFDGKYGTAFGPLNNASYLSLPIASPTIQVGAPSTLPKDPNETSVRVNGGFVSTQGQGKLDSLPQFTAEALVTPEWDIPNERDFFAVMDSSVFVPGLGAPGPGRNAGFAVYAGPDNPADPANSPMCWQLWIGTGNEFARANPLDGSPGPLVSAQPTYLAVTYSGTEAYLWAFTVDADLDQVKFALIPRPYVEAKESLDIGISTKSSALIPPFPGPFGFIYPFVGRIAEVAVYNTALDGGRLMSHIMNAFNTTL